MTECVYDESKFCTSCGKGNSVVELDHITGDTICTGCGLVLDSHCFDGGADWRSFADGGVGTGQDSGPQKQRGDITTASNRDGEDVEFGTTMVGGGIMGANLAKAMREVDGGSRGGKGKGWGKGPQLEGLTLSEKYDRLIKSYTSRSRDIASRVGLGENVVQRVVAFLQDLAKKDHLKANKQSPWLSALIHLASKEEGCTKTVREIALACGEMGANKKAMTAVGTIGGKSVKKDELKTRGAAADKFEAMMETCLRDAGKQLGLAKAQAYVEDKDLMQRFVTRLNLSQLVSAPASHIVQQAYRHASVLGPAINRVPQNALMGVGIFVVAWLLDVPVKPTFGQVAVIARVPEATVRTGYQLLHPRLRYFLPPDLVQKCRLAGGVNGLPAPTK